MVALVFLLATSSVVFAALYMTKDVEITGGVSVVGAIEVYDDDGTTVLTSFTFPNFTGGVSDMYTKQIFINNTGNQPVYVYWNISTSSISWGKFSSQYYHEEAVTYKYWLDIKSIH